MPWPLYLALKQLFPTGRRLSFFAVISVVGVLLGVAVLLVVQTIMNGFQAEIRDKLVDSAGHIRLDAGTIITGHDALMARIEQTPHVVAAAPYIEDIVMLQHDNRPFLPALRGIDIERERKVLPLDRFLVMGNLDHLDDQSILLATGLAREIGASLGSIVEVYSPLMLNRLNEDEVLLPRRLEVVGLFEVGWNEVDSRTALCSLRFMQEIYGLDTQNGVYGISVRVTDHQQVLPVARDLEAHFGPQGFRIRTWQQHNAELLFVLRLEKTIMFFVTLFIVLVASFSISSSLLITVIRKTREIGLLAAIGATPRHIAAIFCIQGFLISLLGSTLGAALAMLSIHYRNAIVHAFARLTQSEAALLRYYGFADIPARYTLSDFLITIAFTVTIATLAGLLPAIRAARLRPAEALRHE